MKQGLRALFLSFPLMFCYQNCSKVAATPINKHSICNGVPCILSSLTDKPAVTTVLIALGDEADNQLVVKGASAQLIVETIVRYSSPVNNPRILIVQDYNISGEDPEDTVHLKEMLSRYNVTYIIEPTAGLKADQLEGFDLVWFNNPGHPMSNIQTRDTLIAFKGAVVLHGDDLTRGDGFELEALTGLKHQDNGTSLLCGSHSYKVDNNMENQYEVTLDQEKIPGVNASTIDFRYGNDIDLSTIARSDLEVLAYAKGAPADCVKLRPAIVRWTK